MPVVPTDKIRNVVVLGHTGTGKSTLVEAMLRAAGHASGPFDGCPTVDHEAEERDRGHSLAVSIVSFEFDGHKLNVLDTPGGVEAIGDAYPALRGADTALFVVDATVGIQPQHAELWRVCETRGIPRVVFLNKLDLERGSFQERFDELRQQYGEAITAVDVPLDVHGGEFDGVIDVLHETAMDEYDGHHETIPIPDERRKVAEHEREVLVEHVAEHDDDLLERYLEGELPSTDELVEHVAHEVADGSLLPVLCGSASHEQGVEALLRFLVEDCPSPVPPEGLALDGPTTAFVIKTFSDPYVGRISVLRLLSGGLRTDDELVDQRTGERHRLHQLFTLRGREQTPLSEAAPGDVVAVAKLGDVMTGDVLVANGTSVEVDAPQAPEGFHRVVFEPAAVADDVKLSTALQRLVQEDPAIRITLDAEAGTRILQFLGPTHVDVTVARLRRKYGVEVRVEQAPIDYRETIRKPAAAEGRHVKQSGGHGQYGIVRIEIEPRPRGAGFAFENTSVGGVVPSTYVPSVEKGVIEAMKNGPLGGFPVVDVGVRLTDGKHHSVDSSDAAFRMAGVLAFRNAVADASPVLLEPIVAIGVSAPDELTGAVLADLSARRGRILSTTSMVGGWTLVEAHVPESELTTFTPEFRALTSGRGEVTMAYDHHDEVPDSVARRLLEKAPTA